MTLSVGRQEGQPACKKWGIVEVGTGWSGWSGAQPDGHCLPLLIFPCTIKSKRSLLAPAHLGGPGKRAVKRLWWWLYQVTGSGRHPNLYSLHHLSTRILSKPVVLNSSKIFTLFPLTDKPTNQCKNMTFLAELNDTLMSRLECC